MLLHDSMDHHSQPARAKNLTFDRVPHGVLCTAVAETAQRPDPGLVPVMAALDHVPVLLLGHRGDVLARNALLPQCSVDRPKQGRRSSATSSSTLSRARGSSTGRFFARNAVAALRLAAEGDCTTGACRPHRRTARRRPQRRTWWEDHAVRDYASVTKHIRHPEAGDLVFGIEEVAAPHEPDQRLTIYTVDPESSTDRVLPILSSWALNTADK
jgi:hypothetical protein